MESYESEEKVIIKTAIYLNHGYWIIKIKAKKLYKSNNQTKEDDIAQRRF